MGALLFAGGALSAIPSSLLLEPNSVAGIYVLAALALMSALVCLAVPWEKLGVEWLNLIAIGATIEIAAAMALADPSYGVYLFFVAIYIGYVIRNVTILLGHFALITLVLLSPVVYSDGAQETVRTMLLLIPGVALAGGMVAFLRARLEAKELAYRAFAEEAFELVTRIRRKPHPNLIQGAGAKGIPAAPIVPAELEQLVNQGAAIGLGSRRRKHRPVYRPALLGASVASLSILGLVTLALLGIALPDSARAPFEAIGISLPKQEDGLIAGPTAGERLAGATSASRPLATMSKRHAEKIRDLRHQRRLEKKREARRQHLQHQQRVRRQHRHHQQRIRRQHQRHQQRVRG